VKKQLSKVLQCWITAGAAPGAACVLSKKGGDRHIATAGFLSPHGLAITPNTRYDLASITKLYTAALVLRSVEAGHLTLDTPVAEYLQAYATSRLTIADLLCHRAGFRIRLGPLRARHGSDFPRQVLTITPPIQRADDVVYENITYLHLGALLESLTGEPLEAQMARLCSDLGLDQTGPRAAITPDTYVAPTAYVDGVAFDANTHDESARLFGGLAGNAGIFADVLDLHAFGKCWLDGEVVSRSLLMRRVLHNHGTAQSRRMGLGWWLDVPGMHPTSLPAGLFNHSGFTGCMLAIQPETETVLALVCNRTLFGRDNQIHRKLWASLIKACF